MESLIALRFLYLQRSVCRVAEFLEDSDNHVRELLRLSLLAAHLGLEERRDVGHDFAALARDDFRLRFSYPALGVNVEVYRQVVGPCKNDRVRLINGPAEMFRRVKVGTRLFSWHRFRPPVISSLFPPLQLPDAVLGRERELQAVHVSATRVAVITPQRFRRDLLKEFPARE